LGEESERGRSKRVLRFSLTRLIPGVVGEWERLHKTIHIAHKNVMVIILGAELFILLLVRYNIYEMCI
jgi:hypothetical protein